MDNNLQNDDSLTESKDPSLNFKTKNYGKIVILLLVLIIAVFWFIYKSSNSGIITIISKDWNQKMSLMKNDTKYSWPSSCPKWYHIPTSYERRKLWKLWCENHETCDDNGYIWYQWTFSWYGDIRESKYNTERQVVYYYEIQKFFHDVNIHLKKHFNFGAWFIATKDLWIKNNNSYCDALDAYDSLNWSVFFSVDYYRLEDCNKKPKYVRCFSDENLTSEFIDEENFSSEYGLQPTKFKIDGTIYSWRKVTSMPRWDVVIPDSFVWIPIIEVWGGLYGNITSVKLGNNIIKIDSHAFASNGIWIKEIEFPNSVLYIWDYAFLNNQLTSVKFSDNLLYIWESAFNNNKLTSVKLPDTVKFIGTWAFSNNKDLFFLKNKNPY